MMDALFQAGIILGKINKLCVERGVAPTGAGIALEDLLVLFTEELSSLPVSASTRVTIADEVHNLAGALSEYEKDQRLNNEDSRIMIRLVSRWTDMLLDELIENSQSASAADISLDNSNTLSHKEPGPTTHPRISHENRDSNHSIPGDTQEIITGSQDRLVDRE